ncbi:MAG: sensor domain-containing diguanylate cyclase [Burkholderiaceae bacterium]
MSYPLRRKTFFSRIAPPLARHPNGIVVGCALFVLLMSTLVVAILMQERRDAVARAAGNAENLAVMVERDLSHTFALFDLSLQALAEGIRDPGVMALPLPYRQQLLFDRAAVAGPHMGSLLYVDASGAIAVDSGSAVPRGGDFSDRSWFFVHRDSPDAGLYISPPYQSRLRDGDWSIAFSRRVNHADGSFAGVVVGAMRIEYFRRLLAGLKLGMHGTITLLHAGGSVLMRNPEPPGTIGRSLKGSANFERFIGPPGQWFFGTAALDAERRLYVYRKFETIPLVLSIAPAARDIYAAWTRRAWTIGTLAALLAAALLGAAWLLAEEFRYRLQTETSLLLLSRTDGLTGLSNRRMLDEALAREWRRAQRAGTPLAVLFVDIDRFKNYNDHYGHQAGDDALAAVAQAIGDAIRRPGDTAARYGGEEFVVVLPETDLGGALAVAAAIHDAVRALAIPHERSDYPLLTVSIGAACNPTGGELDVAALLKAADDALYAAKTGGRNRTMAAVLPAVEAVN